MEEQKANLIIVRITQPPKPAIQMITEAGLIGKIGLNSAGVGVCFNAIRAYGMEPSRVPVHLGLRLVLESTSRDEAISRLESLGMASSAHMLISDATHGAIGLEFSSKTFARLPQDEAGRVYHSNHFLADHPDVHDTVWLADSPFRVKRIQELANDVGSKQAEPTIDSFRDMFKDESNYPSAICRAEVQGSDSATLFNIVMDLSEKKGIVTLGRPCAVEDTVVLSFM
jgi:isopenicillin-N N-acyltransferase-like protein